MVVLGAVCLEPYTGVRTAVILFVDGRPERGWPNNSPEARCKSSEAVYRHVIIITIVMVILVERKSSTIVSSRRVVGVFIIILAPGRVVHIFVVVLVPGWVVCFLIVVMTS